MPVWPDSWPNVVAVADIDGDGRDDAIVATTTTQQQGNATTDYRLYIFHQTAAGTLASPVTVRYTTLEQEEDQFGGNGSTSLAVEDFNGDGIDDLVIGIRWGLAFVHGRHDRAYEARRVLNNANPQPGGEDLVFLDVDHDGYKDILALDSSAINPPWGTTVYYGDEMASFTRQHFTKEVGISKLSSADMDGDGFPDMVVHTRNENLPEPEGVEIRYSDGTGLFQRRQFLPRPEGIAKWAMSVGGVGDFNGDGMQDVIMAGRDPDFTGGDFFLFVQGPVGVFQPAIKLPSTKPKDTADNPHRMLAADMNRDGKDDLVSLRSGGLLGYFPQRGGALQQEQPFAGPYATWFGTNAIAVGDLNGDGCPDIASANYNYGLVVWNNIGCQ